MSKTRNLDVQVPGKAPAEKPETTTAAATGTADTSGAPAPEPAPVVAAPAYPDMEAMRAQIRDEERANARAELAGQIQAASTVIAEPAGRAGLGKRDYANMRATDIDPASLTAPVLTKDGYLCPLPPEAKK